MGVPGRAEDDEQDVGQKAQHGEQDDDQPGRQGAQHAGEDKVHPLLLQKRPYDSSPEEAEEDIEDQ